IFDERLEEVGRTAQRLWISSVELAMRDQARHVIANRAQRRTLRVCIIESLGQPHDATLEQRLEEVGRIGHIPWIPAVDPSIDQARHASAGGGQRRTWRAAILQSLI